MVSRSSVAGEGPTFEDGDRTRRVVGNDYDFSADHYPSPLTHLKLVSTIPNVTSPLLPDILAI